jgi:hypothetical protein
LLAGGTILNFLVKANWNASNAWVRILIWFRSDRPMTQHGSNPAKYVFSLSLEPTEVLQGTCHWGYYVLSFKFYQNPPTKTFSEVKIITNYTVG